MRTTCNVDQNYKNILSKDIHVEYQNINITVFLMTLTTSCTFITIDVILLQYTYYDSCFFVVLKTLTPDRYNVIK